MKKRTIRNGIVVTPFEMLRDMAVDFDDDLITGLSQASAIPATDAEIIDAHGCYVCPGFVDIHTHGGGGSDFMDASEQAFKTALRFHSEKGTTALLASTVSAPLDQITAMLDVARRRQHQVLSGCRLLGVHLEGPFLSIRNKGAHLQQYLTTPESTGWQFIRDYADVIINVTVAPELPGCLEMIRELIGTGIVVSGGHDDALDTEIKAAVNAGMSNITHVFCANSTLAFHNRQRGVGLANISLIEDRLTVEMIADNHHLPPDLVRLIHRCKGAGGACVVSDCMRAGGMPADGRIYTLGPKHEPDAQQAVVDDGVASLADHSRFAGSITPLSTMVRNLVRDCSIPLPDAVQMASLTPATIIHRQKDIGSIASGKKADFCFLDQELQVVRTIVAGETVYQSKQMVRRAVRK